MAGDGHQNIAFTDVCAGGGAGGGQIIVNSIRTTYFDIGNVDGFSRSHVFVGEGGAIAVGQRVAAAMIVAEGDSGARGAVIDLADTAGAKAQKPFADVGAGSSRAACWRVVSGIGATKSNV